MLALGKLGAQAGLYLHLAPNLQLPSSPFQRLQLCLCAGLDPRGSPGLAPAAGWPRGGALPAPVLRLAAALLLTQLTRALQRARSCAPILIRALLRARSSASALTCAILRVRSCLACAALGSSAMQRAGELHLGRSPVACNPITQLQVCSCLACSALGSTTAQRAGELRHGSSPAAFKAGQQLRAALAPQRPVPLAAGAKRCAAASTSRAAQPSARSIIKLPQDDDMYRQRRTKSVHCISSGPCKRLHQAMQTQLVLQCKLDCKMQLMCMTSKTSAVLPSQCKLARRLAGSPP